MSEDHVSYTMASSKWRRSGYVEIISTHGTPIASFPINFLASCGDNTWHFVQHVISLVIEVDPHFLGTIVNIDGQEVDVQGAPAIGTFHYVEKGAVSSPFRHPGSCSSK